MSNLRPGEVLKQPVFWLMYMIFVIVASGGLMTAAQIAPIAKDFKIANIPVNLLGFEMVALTFAISLDRIFDGFGRPFFGFVSDKIGRENTMFIAFSTAAAALLVLSTYGQTPLVFVLASALFFRRLRRNLQPVSGHMRRYVWRPICGDQRRHALHRERHRVAARAARQSRRRFLWLARGFHDRRQSERNGGVDGALRVETSALQIHLTQPTRHRRSNPKGEDRLSFHKSFKPPRHPEAAVSNLPVFHSHVEKDSMKICIYGAGAIGAYVGLMLHRGGADVSLIARGANLDAIKSDGVKLIIGNEVLSAKIPASKDPRDFGPQDYVIIGLKSYQAWESAEDMTPLLGPHTAVVTAQNGVPWWYFHGLGGDLEGHRLKSVDPDDRQWNIIGPERVIGCTVYPATELESPGVVRHVYGDQFGFGEPNRAKTERLARLYDAFAAGKMKPRLFDDIRDDIWVKLWGNLSFNPISALTHATLDIVATDPGTRALAKSMMLEAKAIGDRLGVSFRVDVERRIDGAAKVGAHRTSMLQDVQKKRLLEIDALVSAVKEMGEIVGVATPYIDTVLALVRQMGRSNGLYPTFPEPAIIRPVVMEAPKALAS